MIETINSQVNEYQLTAFSNDSFGLTANVRRSGDVFEIVVIDALSGDEVLSTNRSTREEAERFAAGLMNPEHDPSAFLLRSGMQWS